jgi:hypothetical protein
MPRKLASGQSGSLHNDCDEALMPRLLRLVTCIISRLK